MFQLILAVLTHLAIVFAGGVTGGLLEEYVLSVSFGLKMFAWAKAFSPLNNNKAKVKDRRDKSVFMYVFRFEYYVSYMNAGF